MRLTPRNPRPLGPSGSAYMARATFVACRRERSGEGAHYFNVALKRHAPGAPRGRRTVLNKRY